MHPFREKTPKHRKNRKPCKHYKYYRDTLRIDFNERCGYCNDSDLNFKRSFVIDHFVPQNPSGFSHTIAPNYYYNLIYACSFCNGKKSNTWATGDAAKHNDGSVGFIMPTKKAYGNLFERAVDGTITVKNNSPLGKYIHNELNLGWILHSLNWKFGKILQQEKTLENIYKKSKDTTIKAEIDSLKIMRVGIVDEINEIFNGR